MAKSLNITRFIQDKGHCAIAACAATANYYDSSITYEQTKEIAYSKVCQYSPRDPKNWPGMEDGDIGILLNHLGFKSVTLICSDLNIVDYSWQKKSKKSIIKELEKTLKRNSSTRVKALHRFMTSGYRNRIKVDFQYSDYIRKWINKKRPLVLSYNWNMLFKYRKEKDGKPDPCRGDWDWHSVVVNGYNNKSVRVVDSGVEYYKYELAKYRRGRYCIPWESLLVCLGMEGTMHLPMNHELV